MTKIPAVFGKLKQLTRPEWRRFPPLVGIDITSSCVKLLEFGSGSPHYSIKSFSIVPLPPGVIENNEVRDLQAVAEAIRIARKRSRTKAKHAAVAVSASSIISKTLQMDSAYNDSDLESQILLEAGAYIPYPIEEVNLDFVSLGSVVNHPEKQNVLVVASRAEKVAMLVDVLEEAGFKAMVVDVDSYAKGRACALLAERLQNQPDPAHSQVIALFDIGKMTSSLTVLRDLNIIYTGDEAFGGHLITEKIREYLDCSYDEAVIAKKTGFLPNESEEKDEHLFEISREMIFNHVNHLLQFYLAANHQNIDHILLSGGSVGVPGLETYIENRLNIPATIADPFQNMDLSSDIDPDYLHHNARSLLVCCGLALRRFQHA